jgi:hypothetical protein
MSVIKICNEDEPAHQGHELVPMKGEIDTVLHGLVWEMNDDQFAAFASQFNTAQCAAMIRDAHQQCLACFKRGAEWYYAAGRWLAWVKAKKLHEPYGGWEVFCKEECKISPSQAWKYKEFAERFKPEQISSFDGKRFSLERALGYEGPAKKKKPSSKVTGTKQAPKVEQHEAEEEEQPTKAPESSKATEAEPTDADDGGDPADAEAKPSNDLADQEGKELKAYQESIRKPTPKMRAVAILHALELLREELKGDEVDEELQQTFDQIAQLAEELKGLNSHDQQDS